MEAISLARDTFYTGASDVSIKVKFFWGIDSIDKENIDSWDPAALGEIVWDYSFDLSPKEN